VGSSNQRSKCTATHRFASVELGGIELMKQFTLDLSKAGNINTSLLEFRPVTAAPWQALSSTVGPL
jgi:hypothetical protein